MSSCSEVSANEVIFLTKILQLLPNEDAISYHSRITTLTSNLPSCLKRPNRLSRLFFPPRDQASLCKLHKHLNVRVVHSLFALVTLEVGVRLNSLATHQHLLAPSHVTLVAKLRSLHALWLEPVDYARTFLQEPPMDQRRRFQRDGCEACVLARVGGEREVLFALRTVVLARTRTKKGSVRNEPRLMRFVEAWVEGLGGDESVLKGLRESSWWDAQVLKETRKSVRKGERAAQQQRIGREREPEKLKDVGQDHCPCADGATSSKAETYRSHELPDSSPTLGTEDTPVSLDWDAATTRGDEQDVWDDDVVLVSAEDEKEKEENPENEIIDIYAALLSTPPLPSSLLARPTSISASESESGTTTTTTLVGGGQIKASESQYSFETTFADVNCESVCFNVRPSVQGRSRSRTAAELAGSYQDLLRGWHGGGERERGRGRRSGAPSLEELSRERMGGEL